MLKHQTKCRTARRIQLCGVFVPFLLPSECLTHPGKFQVVFCPQNWYDISDVICHLPASGGQQINISDGSWFRI